MDMRSTAPRTQTSKTSKIAKIAKPAKPAKTTRSPRERRLVPELAKVLLTVDEAAHTLSTSRSGCYRLMQSGQLQYILVGATRRIPVDAITEFVQRQLGRAIA